MEMCHVRHLDGLRESDALPTLGSFAEGTALFGCCQWFERNTTGKTIAKQKSLKGPTTPNLETPQNRIPLFDPVEELNQKVASPWQMNHWDEVNPGLYN